MSADEAARIAAHVTATERARAEAESTVNRVIRQVAYAGFKSGWRAAEAYYGHKNPPVADLKEAERQAQEHAGQA